MSLKIQWKLVCFNLDKSNLNLTTLPERSWIEGRHRRSLQNLNFSQNLSFFVCPLNIVLLRPRFMFMTIFQNRIRFIYRSINCTWLTVVTFRFEWVGGWKLRKNILPTLRELILILPFITLPLFSHKFSPSFKDAPSSVSTNRSTRLVQADQSQALKGSPRASLFPSVLSWYNWALRSSVLSLILQFFP